LLRLGHGHRRSVVILWAWTAILSGFILFPLFVKAVNPFIPLGVGILAAALFTWFHPDLRRRPEPPGLTGLATTGQVEVDGNGKGTPNGGAPTRAQHLVGPRSKSGHVGPDRAETRADLARTRRRRVSADRFADKPDQAR